MDLSTLESAARPARRKSPSTGTTRRASISRRCRSCATAHGFAIGGAGEIVEWVSHMRRFDENATLDRVAERDGAIRRDHRQAGAGDPPLPRARAACATRARRAHELETYIEQNDAAFAERPDLFPPASGPPAHLRIRASLSRSRGRRCSARGASGYVRRCHGDLHLRNIALIDGEPILFDAVEFSDDDRQRRRALRSCVPADGSGGARPARRRQPAVQPLSGA